MLSTLRHAGGKRKVGESGAVAGEDPDDGDGYAVKMLCSVSSMSHGQDKQVLRSLSETLELVPPPLVGFASDRHCSQAA